MQRSRVTHIPTATTTSALSNGAHKNGCGYVDNDRRLFRRPSLQGMISFNKERSFFLEKKKEPKKNPVWAPTSKTPLRNNDLNAKGDIFNELRMGTFSKRFDTSFFVTCPVHGDLCSLCV